MNRKNNKNKTKSKNNISNNNQLNPNINNDLHEDNLEYEISSTVRNDNHPGSNNSMSKINSISDKSNIRIK